MKDAYLNTYLVTGDNINTAVKIGIDIGLFNPNKQIIICDIKD